MITIKPHVNYTGTPVILSPPSHEVSRKKKKKGPGRHASSSLHEPVPYATNQDSVPAISKNHS